MKNAIEVSEYIRPAAAGKVRLAIKAAGGNEVFFLGKSDSKLVVEDVAVLARGDGESVPAIIRKAAISDVVIHNHPDSVLYPSKEDLAVASELGNRGVGFYIVDNAVESIYPVVHPSAREELVPLRPEKLKEFIMPGGPLSIALGEYEQREEQLKMLQEVALAFNEDRISLIEAGTGTGKSLAYLIPAISWSLQNGERVVVSTNTINLQEQLTGKDLPLLQRISGLRCKAVLVKGRGNYLCRRRLAAALEEGQLTLPMDGRGELEEIAAWSERTADGSLSDLSFIPDRDIWEMVCSEADQCARLHCPFYRDCFFYRARREASSAHVLVVNHHLLMADLAVRDRSESYGGPMVLPRFHRIIIDEAQHLEDVATEHLGFRVSRYAFLKVLGRLQSARAGRRGLLPFLCARMKGSERGADGEGIEEALRLINNDILPERQRIEERVRALFGAVLTEAKKICPENEHGENALRVTQDLCESPFWNAFLLPQLKEFFAAVNSFSLKLKELADLLNSLSARGKKSIEPQLIEMRAMRLRLAGYCSALSFFAGDADGYCRWFELKRGGRGERVNFCAAPLDVAEGLRRAMYRRFGTVVMTSATLTVGGEFTYFMKRVGLGEFEKERVRCSLLPSSFNYVEQAFVGAPRGIPEPDTEDYEGMLDRVVREAVEISRGRAFVLFTSYRLLERLHERLKPRLAEKGITALRQGDDNRTALLNRFRSEGAAALFATDSFWEGVDVRGEALQCVILTRLPFRVPSEPIQQARMEAIEAGGGDPFLEYSVPQAVIKFRQGFGRLIRHRSDVGAVLILDARIHTRRYGELFLTSLPAVSLCALDSGGVLGEMKKFFARVRRESAASAPGRAAGGKPAN